MGKLTYRDAGVDTKEGERAVKLMKDHVKKTFNDNVLTGLGGFGGLFRLPVEGMKEPVLVSGTDGVGTKLKIAFMMDKHDTVGIDCVAMCVNDILCQGAKPLFFLDYIATERWGRRRWRISFPELRRAACRERVPLSAEKRRKCRGSTVTASTIWQALA